jgi:hypothetical protein
MILLILLFLIVILLAILLFVRPSLRSGGNLFPAGRLKMTGNKGDLCVKSLSQMREY